MRLGEKGKGHLPKLLYVPPSSSFTAYGPSSDDLLPDRRILDTPKLGGEHLPDIFFCDQIQHLLELLDYRISELGSGCRPLGDNVR